jgi:flagellar basal-body rod protein FlgB
VNITDTTQLGLHSAIIGAGMRQETLAGNIANANTPGYQRKDLDFHTSLRAALDSGAPSEAVKATTFSAQASRGATMRFDGNGVDVDVESAEMASNALEYEALVAVARGRTSILRSAMGLG